MSGLGRPAPAPGLLRRLDGLGRGALPAALTAALLVLAAAWPGGPPLAPALALGSVVFWSVFRPASLPPPVTFALGLLWDLLAFAPPGVGVLSLLAVQAAALRARGALARWPFLAVWLAQAALAAAATAGGHALHALLGWRLPPAAPTLVQLALCVGLYPPLSWALTRLHRALERAEALA